MILSNILLTVAYASPEFQNGKAEFEFREKPYELVLKPGRYRFEAYGASGGGSTGRQSIARDPYNKYQCLPATKNNTICNIATSQPGAGGYIAGDIIFLSATKIFIYVGGQGQYSKNPTTPGGYNGGGYSISNSQTDGSGSGGGSTDFRLVNDTLYNRVLVAGAGGGTDNEYAPNPYESDDGTGGSGGYPGQGMWLNGVYNAKKEVNTSSGFMFGRGQDAISTGSEGAGAGSGFFGGYASDDANAGGGGGSSFAFSNEMPYPTENIVSINPLTANQETKKYAFLDFPQYKMFNIVHETGVHVGNGYATIATIEYLKIRTCSSTKRTPILSFSVILSLESSYV